MVKKDLPGSGATDVTYVTGAGVREPQRPGSEPMDTVSGRNGCRVLVVLAGADSVDSGLTVVKQGAP
jgi:hypothetical protein